MKKYTLREIKRFVSLGLAQDITTANCPAIKEPFEKKRREPWHIVCMKSLKLVKSRQRMALSLLKSKSCPMAHII